MTLPIAVLLLVSLNIAAHNGVIRLIDSFHLFLRQVRKFVPGVFVRVIFLGKLAIAPLNLFRSRAARYA
jgi:hypothetical protein